MIFLPAILLRVRPPRKQPGAITVSRKGREEREINQGEREETSAECQKKKKKKEKKEEKRRRRKKRKKRRRRRRRRRKKKKKGEEDNKKVEIKVN